MIEIRTHRKRGSVAEFYPTTRFYGVVSDEKGRYLGETGYCKTRENAARAAERLAEKLIG